MKEKDFIEKCCFALEVEIGTLNQNSSPDTVETWDSLGYLSLLAMIDEELGIIIDAEEMGKLKTLGDIIKYLINRGVIDRDEDI